MVNNRVFIATMTAFFLLSHSAVTQTQTEEKAQEEIPEIAPLSTQESEDIPEGKDFESFDPSVEISTDNAVSFPTDI